MKDYEKRFVRYLSENSLKLTRTRRLILDAVFKTHDHVDVDTLYNMIKADHSDVSLATIYRTMPLLVEAGLIKQSLRYQSKDHYEHVFGHRNHIHLLCENCGKIIEISGRHLEEFLKNETQKHSFEFIDYTLNVTGLCHKCRKALNRKIKR
ncbi:MAG: transcriptional repressor [Candidatus Cloacimonetes bacterium]|nr:transcriptional repressor [Candidatus Cloacimonadota bacterium]